MNYNLGEKLDNCINIIKGDICEAISADELLYVIESHVNNWRDPPDRLGFGLQFAVDALAFRMAFAINRVFQPASEDRANFAQLRNLCVGSTSVSLDEALKKVEKLGKSEDLIRLKACRDGFMAHSLLGSAGNRDGMHVSLLSNVLRDAEHAFEEIHQTLKGESANLGKFRQKWQLRSSEFWRNRLPDEATSQRDDLASADRLAVEGELGKNILDSTDGLTSFSEWQKFLGRLEPLEVGAAWSEACKHSLPPFFMLSFHSAVIDRLLEIAHFSVRVTDEQRAKTVDFVEELIAVVHKQFASDPEALVGFDAAIANARKFYESFGTPATRDFLFDRGLRDAWGAEPQDADDKK